MEDNRNEKDGIRVEDIEINGDPEMAAYMFILHNYSNCPRYFDTAGLIFYFLAPLSHFFSFRIISISNSDTVLDSHVTAVLLLL